MNACHDGPMSEDEGVVISVIWPDIQSLPILRANQFIVQTSSDPNGGIDEFVLSIGYAAPPVILGTAEEQQVSIRALGAVEAKAIARVSISPAYMRALVNLLQTHIANVERNST